MKQTGINGRSDESQLFKESLIFLIDNSMYASLLEKQEHLKKKGKEQVRFDIYHHGTQAKWISFTLVVTNFFYNIYIYIYLRLWDCSNY